MSEVSFISDFKSLIKLRLTFLVVFSASVSFLIGSREQGSINWINWLILTLGGFLVAGAANGFNEIIEKDLDKLMSRTSDRPIPSGRMTTGQALVLSLFMALAGTLILVRLNFLTGVLSVFSIFLYAIVYTPAKRLSPIAVFIGAFPGALPPLIGYFAAFDKPVISWIPLVLFFIQFVWQFPHFWAIAWVLDDDYKKAGFRLLPTKKRDRVSAGFIIFSALVLIPVSLLPTFMGFGGYVIGIISLIAGIVFLYLSVQLFRDLEVKTARKVMFCSFFYLPLVQLIMLFDFIK
ncbi:Heme O synthase, protoheme IX farnesyltransferase COX10-CtaB [Arcticibacter svalbardensis MN12-7]|uniref:Protoheme IX farnesyltransferase n=1 Tax=Arcticibacter svalbardensis MN12-7 TaxID=1150600 RepID=R9GUN9_9SPHI|nr:heme o synthase [Arcticibacter svalbardensis]EOR95220.1 Heme O synthase, protoheme IX farnesyltransferase COX10-CtaB [Arcticibacter svalbardensis MN12-7]